MGEAKREGVAKGEGEAKREGEVKGKGEAILRYSALSVKQGAIRGC